MAYIDEGEGAPIVFQHGDPTSSCPWRKVMPACAGLGRTRASSPGDASRRSSPICPTRSGVTVPGGHFLQETSGPAIGTAVADFVRRLRA